MTENSSGNKTYSAKDDFSPFIYKLRQIDLTKIFGAGSTYDGKKHIWWVSLLFLFIGFSLIYWLFVSASYQYLKRSYEPRQSKKLTSHIASSVHAVVAVLIWLQMTFISCAIPGQTFFTNKVCLDTTSPGMQIGIVMTVSYMFQDIFNTHMVFGPGKMTSETIFHHLIGLVGLVSALVIGRIVGVIAVALLITETSTIFLTNRHVMKELKMEQRHPNRYFWNGIALIVSFFITRILFLGFFLGAYVIPAFINYPYKEAAQQLGWFLVRWAQTLMILFILLYVLNIYWFAKLILGCKRFIQETERKQNRVQLLEIQDV